MNHEQEKELELPVIYSEGEVQPSSVPDYLKFSCSCGPLGDMNHRKFGTFCYALSEGKNYEISEGPKVTIKFKPNTFPIGLVDLIVELKDTREKLSRPSATATIDLEIVEKVSEIMTELSLISKPAAGGVPPNQNIIISCKCLTCKPNKKYIYSWKIVDSETRTK